MMSVPAPCLFFQVETFDVIFQSSVAAWITRWIRALPPAGQADEAFPPYKIWLGQWISADKYLGRLMSLNEQVRALVVAARPQSRWSTRIRRAACRAPVYFLVRADFARQWRFS